MLNSFSKQMKKWKGCNTQEILKVWILCFWSTADLVIFALTAAQNMLWILAPLGRRDLEGVLSKFLLMDWFGDFCSYYSPEFACQNFLWESYCEETSRERVLVMCSYWSLLWMYKCSVMKHFYTAVSGDINEPPFQWVRRVVGNIWCVGAGELSSRPVRDANWGD